MNKTLHTLLCRLAVACAVALLPSCTDLLFDEGFGQRTDADADGMAFSLSVTEQADLTYSYGGTRAASTPADSLRAAATAFASHPMKGDNPYGLQLHRMPLPYVGIHPRTVAAGSHAPATRASTDDIVSSADSFHDSLTIWGYTDTRTLFSNILLKKIRGWRSSVHWPYDGDNAHPQKSTTMRFYAVAPSLEAMDIKLTNPTDKPIGMTYGPMFKYKVPDDPDEQRDLLYGASGDINVQNGPDGTPRYPNASTPKEQHLGDDDKEVPLNFRHILTAVRFAQGKMPTHVSIKNITLYHIKNSGIFDPNANTTEQWDVDDANEGSYTISTNYTPAQDGYDHTTGENVYIDNGQVLFLMPHTVTNKAELQVELEEKLYTMQRTGDFNNDGKFQKNGDDRVPLLDSNGQQMTRTHTVKASLEGDKWEIGHTVTYKLTIGELADDYYLLAENAQALEFDTISTSNGTFRVHSFHNYVNYSNQNEGEERSGTDVGDYKDKCKVNWKIIGYAEQKDAPTDSEWQELKPDWLTSIDGSSEQTGGLVTANFTVSTMEPARKGNHEDILKNNTQATHPAHVNLANHTPWGDFFSRTPANCYIVNRQGTFYFPLIYGNGKNRKKHFVNHAGEEMTSEWISNVLSHGLYKETTEQKYYKLDEENNEVACTDNDDDRIKETKTEAEYTFTQGSMCFRAEVIWQDVAGLIAINNTANDQGVLPQYKDVATDGSSFTPNTTSADGFPEGGLIQFEVKKDHPGNAVIGLYGKREYRTYERTRTITIDEGVKTKGNWTEWKDVSPVGRTYETDENLIWTWHIWMTDEIYPNANSSNTDALYLYSTALTSEANSARTRIVPLKNADGSARDTIMPVNLGWVPDDMNFKFYEPRYVWVKLQQTTPYEEDANGNKQYRTAAIRIMQHARQPLVTGTSTVYQWGRPTALPALKYVRKAEGEYKDYNNSDTKGNRPVYDKDGNDISTTFNTVAATAVKDFIANPKSMLKYADTNNWWDASANKYDFWGNSGKIANKTIYDPCPAGFCVPQGSLFTVFSLQSDETMSVSGGSNMNVWPNTSGNTSASGSYGGYFYIQKHTSLTDDDRYGPMVYMPATGKWSIVGAAPMFKHLDNMSKGYYWSSDFVSGNTEWYHFYLYPHQATFSEQVFGFKEPMKRNSGDANGEGASIRPMGNLPTTK